MFLSTSEEWETPQELFDDLNKKHHFTLDPCATDKNCKCAYFFTKDQDGLVQNWGGQIVFCNPPYGRNISKWVAKAAKEGAKDFTKVVMLLPAMTDTAWFHNYIYNKAEVVFLRGRLKFGGSKNSAPFPSMIVIFR